VTVAITGGCRQRDYLDSRSDQPLASKQCRAVDVFFPRCTRTTVL